MPFFCLSPSWPGALLRTKSRVQIPLEIPHVAEGQEMMDVCPHGAMSLSFLPKSSQVPKDSQASNVKISLWVKVLLLERTSGPHWQVYLFHTFGRERTMENQHPSLLQRLSLSLFSLWRNHGEVTEPHPIWLLSLVTMACRRDEQHTQLNMSHRLVCGLNAESPGTRLELPLPFGVHVLKYFALKTPKYPKCPKAPMHKPTLDVILVIRVAE